MYQKLLTKYGYTEQLYYQLFKAYEEKGTEGLEDKKQGLKKNRVRTDTVVNCNIVYDYSNKFDIFAKQIESLYLKFKVQS